MLKLEICYNPITIQEVVSENGLINKICRLFGVSSEVASLETQKEWTQWILTSPFKTLTEKEILNAHKMAINGELLDEDQKHFKIFPMLTPIQSGAILRQYVEFKRNNEVYWKAKQNLKKLAEPKKTQQELEKEKEENFNTYCNIIFNEIKQDGFTKKATHYYSKIAQKIDLKLVVAKRLYRLELNKFLKNFKTIRGLKETKEFEISFFQTNESLAEIKNKIKHGEAVPSVQQKCRDIIVNHYLRKSKSLNDLKQKIKELEG